jgi:DNA-binding transcriptional regulator YiaG
MTPAEYKSARQRIGSQKTVAASLGVSRVTVARRETGGQVITREAALALRALKPKPIPIPK